MNLRDKLKFWIALSNYVDMIVRGTSPLSLPDAIANSLSYVKAFGGTEQRNLPEEYTQVNYVTNTAQTMINTGIKFDFSKNYEIELKARGVAGSWYILQARENTSAPISGISGSSTGNAIGLNFNGTYVAASQISRVVGHIYYVKGTINNGNMTLYVKDETAGTEETVTGTYTVTTGQSVDIGLFGNIAGNYVDINSDIYLVRIKENDTVVMDYVPARQAATAGFYDKVSGTFKTASNLVADGNTVPTPDAPMDIVSNNGVLKVRHQSGLPLGYTLLDYIESSGPQYIDPQVSGNARWVITAQANTVKGSSQSLISSTSLASGGTWYGEFTNTGHWDVASGGTDIPSTTKTTADLTFDGNGVRGTIGSTSVDRAASVTQGTWRIFRTTDGQYPFAGKLFDAKVYQGGVLVRNFIPAKDSNNVVGLYDTVSGTFFTNGGTGTFTAGSTVSDPVEIYTDGTVETINVHNKNLFDEQWNRNTGVSTQAATWGQVVTASGWSTSGLVPVRAGQQYTVSYNTSVIIYIFYYESDGTMQQSYDTTTSTKKTFTVPNGATHIRLQVNKNTEAAIADLETQLETGATNTTYVPYYNGGTAIAEMLLKVGDYQDVQSILDGVVTRNVGVKVMTGDETFQSGTNGWISENTITDNLNAVYTPICTHFAGTDTTPVANSNTVRVYYTSQNVPRVYFGVDKTIYTSDTVFKQYLAQQYAAGTPVIIVYPLATPTTESVAGQTLQVTDGDNTLEITQASLNNLELESKYKKQA